MYTFCRDIRTINVGNLFFGQRFRSSLVDNLESQTRLTHIKLELQFHSNKLMDVHFVPLIALFLRTLQIFLASRLDRESRLYDKKKKKKSYDRTKIRSMTKWKVNFGKYLTELILSFVNPSITLLLVEDNAVSNYLGQYFENLIDHFSPGHFTPRHRNQKFP